MAAGSGPESEKIAFLKQQAQELAQEAAAKEQRLGRAGLEEQTHLLLESVRAKTNLLRLCH